VSVYKRPGQETFSYDFRYKSSRFSGDTGRTNRREAEKAEREVRDSLKAEFKKSRTFGDAPMTLDQACGRYWSEVGEHAASHRDIEWSCRFLINRLGADKPIRDITDDDVSRLVSARRKELVSYPRMIAGKKAKERKPKLVSNATVNRSVIDPLRRILRRAAVKWKETVPVIDWAEHRLPEPKERVRYASEAEESAIFAALPEFYHPVIDFAILSGCRAGEICRLKWSDIDEGAGRMTVIGKGRNGAPKVATIPLSDDMRDILKQQRGKHKEHVFTKLLTGDPISYRALSLAFVGACQKADVTGLRLHDLRHTAATRLLQKSGNLKMVAKLLRHSDVSVTAKYAHVLDDDLKAAMNGLGRKKSHEKSHDADASN
jgi:integrase